MAVQLFAIINVKNSLPGTHQSKIAAAKEPQKNNAKEYTVNRSLATNQPLADSVLWQRAAQADRADRALINFDVSRLSHFAPSVGSRLEKPVMLPPGCARLATRSSATGSLTAGIGPQVAPKHAAASCPLWVKRRHDALR
jgi:hypothetical protein